MAVETETRLESIHAGHHNTLYLIAALCMIFMTLALALQPLFLRLVLDLGRDNAGAVNSNIQVITELVDLLLVGYLGHLSDRFGRLPLIVWGFVISGVSALLVPVSVEAGLLFGVGGLAIFYLARTLMSIGSMAVWALGGTLAGDFTDYHSRPRLLGRVGFMMAFGATLVYAILMQLPKHLDLRVVMLLPAVIAFAGAWLARRHLIEVAPIEEEHTRFPFQRIWALFRRERGLRLAFLGSFSSRNDMILIGLFLMIWFIYYSDLLPEVNHAQAASRAGLLIGFIGMVVLFTIPVWSWIIGRFGRIPAIVLGMGLSGAGFSAMSLVLNPFSPWIFLPAFLVGLGQAGCLLGPQTLTLDLAPATIRGSVMGAFNTVGCIGIIFFLQIGGFLFDWVSPTAPFLFTGIANFLIMGYGMTVMKNTPERGSQAVEDLDLA
ncbi:MAG: MFS transporter [Magnetococcales bacterium]|nr:MFS transporter [Magnetococcales bacterium]